jgi:hypothetical protein
MLAKHVQRQQKEFSELVVAHFADYPVSHVAFL